jgi:hypothetical protein
MHDSKKAGKRNRDISEEHVEVLALDEKLKAKLKSVSSKIKPMNKQLAAKEERAKELALELQASEGPCMEEFNAVTDSLKFERQAWHGGAPNGRDCAKLLQPDVIRMLMEILRPRSISIEGSGEGLAKLARRGGVALKIAKLVELRREKKRARQTASATGVCTPSPTAAAAAAAATAAQAAAARANAVLDPAQALAGSASCEHQTFGCEKLAMRTFQCFNKMRLLRDLYRPSRPMCKHEVAKHEARALSYGCWFPVNYPKSTITPKFHIMIYEHTRMRQLHFMCGILTEEVIEALHRQQNLMSNVTSGIKNTAQRVNLILENQYHRMMAYRH